MFQNHLTDNEQWERPEGSVENLVGKLESDASYEADGPDGPGLYADVMFYESYVSRITEIGKDIGLSVRANGLTEDGEMAGRYGPILVGLLGAKSVDVVTKAGAGGKLTSILESDRELAGRPVEINQEGTRSVTDVTKEDFEALSAALIEAIASIPAALAESLVAPVVEPVVAVVESEEAAVIDHAAIVEALAVNKLPAKSAATIVAAITEGATLEDAVAAQVELREAFASTTAETGTVIIESDKKVSGLARSVQVLKG